MDVDLSGRNIAHVRWQPPEPRKSDVAGLLPVLPAVGTADTRAFIAMLERPLFSATRRPPPPPPPPSASEPPQDNLSSARLSGVYSGGGEGGVIILVAGKQRRLRMNDNIDGWVLKSIQDRVVSFSRGGETRTLTVAQGCRDGVFRCAASFPGLQRRPTAGDASFRGQPAPPRRLGRHPGSLNSSAGALSHLLGT